MSAQCLLNRSVRHTTQTRLNAFSVGIRLDFHAIVLWPAVQYGSNVPCQPIGPRPPHQEASNLLNGDWPVAFQCRLQQLLAGRPGRTRRSITTAGPPAATRSSTTTPIGTAAASPAKPLKQFAAIDFELVALHQFEQLCLFRGEHGQDGGLGYLLLFLTFLLLFLASFAEFGNEFFAFFS